MLLIATTQSVTSIRPMRQEMILESCIGIEKRDMKKPDKHWTNLIFLVLSKSAATNKK